jgi:hypothetical protein
MGINRSIQLPFDCSEFPEPFPEKTDYTNKQDDHRRFETYLHHLDHG